MPEKYIKAADCKKYFYEHLDDVHITGAMNAIDEMPAADVAPVRHGYWIEQCEESLYSCSACGAEWVTIEGTPEENDMGFCPHCGAKMDEEESEKNA